MSCKIERIVTPEHRVVLRVCGRIVGEDVGTLRQAIGREWGRRVAIDLGEVVLVDREAVTLLATSEANGVELRNCRAYVREWMLWEREEAARESERELHEEDLRESEERFRNMAEAAPVMIWVSGANKHCIYFNQQWLDFRGRTLQQELGEGWIEGVHPEDYQRCLLVCNSAFERRESFKMEYRLRRSDGEFRWMYGTAVPRFSAAGEFLGYIGSAIDITERKHAEEQLRESEADFAAAQRVARLGTWRVDIASNALRWSEELYRIFEVAQTKFHPTFEFFLSCVHPDDRPRMAEMYQRVRASGECLDLDYRIVTQAGKVKYIRAMGCAVKDGSGRIVSLFGTAQDVTERKRAQEALQKSRDQLRALAARLQSVREEERTRVAREIHDELGSRLTALKIDLSTLVRDLPPEKAQKHTSILKGVDEIVQTVRRISSELRPPVLDALGLVPAVEWAAEDFEARTGTKCRPDLPATDLVIDPERATALFRIFQETLTNVARHAEATEVNVRLAQEDHGFTLEVHDNGKGIDEKQLSVGSSLGVLGMRERALLLGGELRIRGDPGSGTTVMVRIPQGRHPTAPKALM
jgi:PAS domain S-box-containing protein